MRLRFGGFRWPKSVLMNLRLQLLAALFAVSLVSMTGGQEIPASAFKDARTVTSASADPKFSAGLGFWNGDFGLYERKPFSPANQYWQVKDAESGISLHGWSLDVTERSGVRDRAAMTYDLTGTDKQVYYREPKKGWGVSWIRESVDRSDRARDRIVRFRVAEGELKGWYLDFPGAGEPIEGKYKDTMLYYKPVLVKEPSPRSEFRFSSGHHSGVSP
jgi:hypothetical protein